MAFSKSSVLLALLMLNIPPVEAHQVDRDIKNSGHEMREQPLVMRGQPLVPIMQIGNECPLGFFPSAGYCIPATSAIAAVIPTYSGSKAVSCPAGYRNNNGYCQTFSQSRHYAIPMLTDRCPRGYYNNQSFCIKQ